MKSILSIILLFHKTLNSFKNLIKIQNNYLIKTYFKSIKRIRIPVGFESE